LNVERLKALLKELSEGKTSVETVLEALKRLPYEDIGFARIDHHRELRRGFPEVVLCTGKTPDQVAEIVEKMVAAGNNVLATRATAEMYETVKAREPRAEYDADARALTVIVNPVRARRGKVAVVCAGTSDIPVAAEAAATLRMAGNQVEEIRDVGVAGIHRVLDCVETLRQASVVVVVAGMEGALASVVGGLVDTPVIAVPTSVGYGASFGGIAPLLTMLNSCVPGVAVVNIDNGFGAGYLASMINELAERADTE
jgi:NCAIR mutase (PurE)-related protein